MTPDTPLKRFRRFDETGEPARETSEPGESTSGHYCPNCGAAMPAVNRYCNQCGTGTDTFSENQNNSFVSEKEASATASLKPYIAQAPSAERKTSALPWVIGILAAAFIIGTGLIVVNGMGYSSTSHQSSVQGTRYSSQPTSVGLSQIIPTNSTSISGANDPTHAVPKPTTTLAIVIPTIRINTTPTEALTSCPGAPKQRLEVGKDARVCTKVDNVYLREGPAKSNAVIARVAPGTLVEVIGGPKCSDNWSYWEVKIPDHTIGWMSEGGDRTDPYFLCPIQ